MARPDQLPYERRLAEIERAYRDAQRMLIAQLRRAVADGRLTLASERRAQLSAALTALAQLGYETDPIARQLVREAWQESAARTEQLIAQAGIPIEGSFSGVSTAALVQLEESAASRLAEARRTIGRSIDDVFARAGRRSTVLQLLGASPSRQVATKRLVEDLTRQGIRSFTDRAGKRWALQNYAEMVVRTTTREAVVAGALDRMSAQGIDMCRVSHHPGSCPVCAPWDNRLVSIDGRRSELNGESAATLDALPNGGPPFHPRCRHTLVPEVSFDEGRAAA